MTYQTTKQTETIVHEASQGLEKLGQGATTYRLTTKDPILEVFPAPKSLGEQKIHLRCPEFTSRCPKTDQPDYGEFDIYYIPDELCVESKSLKLYLGAFRDEGHFHEECTAKIHDDLVNIMKPKWIKVVGNFKPRGGISINPTVESVKVDTDSDV